MYTLFTIFTCTLQTRHSSATYGGGSECDGGDLLAHGGPQWDKKYVSYDVTTCAS